MYKQAAEGIMVLLVHPSGNYNRKSPWSIPKGEPNADEQLEQAARRETKEETGIDAGQLTALGSADYKKSRKRIFCFAGPIAPEVIPICASWEVDRAEFLSLEQARASIHPDQAVFIDRLTEHLENQAS